MLRVEAISPPNLFSAGGEYAPCSDQCLGEREKIRREAYHFGGPGPWNTHPSVQHQEGV